MMSLIAGSASSSSSGPRPSSSSTSTFSSANCSRRLRLILSSVSTSQMIGRNSSASSSLVRVAAASGSTRSSRRGSTCSLIRWTEASKPSDLLLPCFAAGVLARGQAVHRAHRRTAIGDRGVDRWRQARRAAGTGRRPRDRGSRRKSPPGRALHRLGDAEIRASAAHATTLAECAHATLLVRFPLKSGGE